MPLPRRLVPALLAALLLPACASAPPRRPGPPAGVVPPVGTVVTGTASWYGPGYDGKRTSSGEVFDQDALTAAHYDWAFGTRVEVTLLSTGKKVVTKIEGNATEIRERWVNVHDRVRASLPPPRCACTARRSSALSS